jgi:disulfide bond formation protein DsbB
MGKRYTRIISKRRSKWDVFSKNECEYDIKEACARQALFPRYRPGYCSPYVLVLNIPPLCLLMSVMCTLATILKWFRKPSKWRIVSMESISP